MLNTAQSNPIHMLDSKGFYVSDSVY